MDKKGPEQRYEALQLLRFLAAFMVVVAHGTQTYSLRLKGSDGSDYWHFGTIGVDIFFVISGYMMAMTTRGAGAGVVAAWKFLIRRIVRVVPIYWIFTALKLLIVLVVPVASLKAMPTVSHIAASLLFIPHQAFDGQFWPVLPVGWTLNFEMFFYAVFAVMIATGVHRILGVALAFGVIALIGQLDLSPGFLVFYCDSLLIEFLFGMALAGFVASPRWLEITGRKKDLLVTVLCVAAVVFVLLEGQLPRGLTWGVSAACVVCVALLMEQRVRTSRLLRQAVPAGDSSYSLYLTHTFTLPAAVVLAGKVIGLNQAVVVLFAVLASVVVAEVAYRLIERPLLRAISRRLPRS